MVFTVTQETYCNQLSQSPVFNLICNMHVFEVINWNKNC